MTRLDFYSLASDSRGDRFLLVCRLVERICAQSLRALILCPDPEEARHCDRLLWTFKQESFLPHGLIGQVDAQLTPILISADAESTHHCSVLVNLGRELPPSIERFERLCDLVDQDATIRQAGRERFRAYRAQGYTPEHHTVRL